MWGDMYIRLKDSKMSARLNDFLDKNNIKYFTIMDKIERNSRHSWSYKINKPL